MCIRDSPPSLPPCSTRYTPNSRVPLLAWLCAVADARFHSGTGATETLRAKRATTTTKKKVAAQTQYTGHAYATGPRPHYTVQVLPEPVVPVRPLSTMWKEGGMLSTQHTTLVSAISDDAETVSTRRAR
eukprot:782048-Rhodomonas_salina.7